ncbi:MAG: DUF11 domain-containing protein [Bacteroidetes bacterium]|nr:DUF11 domain-containing protein [Bacteroidota bacterium]
MKRTFTNLFLLFIGLGLHFSATAQQQGPLDIALRYMGEQQEAWQLSEKGLRDVVLRDRVYSKHNGTTHLYFNQRHAGIEVHNAINGVHVQDNEVKFATNRFIPNIAERVNTTAPSLSAEEAVRAAAKHLGLPSTGRLGLKSQDGHHYTFAGGAFSNSDIKVQLVYQITETEEARLAWDLALDMPTSADYWSLRVDALSGLVLEQNNWTISCNFDAPSHQHKAQCGLKAQKPSIPLWQAWEAERSLLIDGAQYNVYPLPYESPNDGPREMVVNPADSTASPFGWHDTNGVEGPEYTITRGNNVHAFLDVDATDTSQGDEPDGGEELIFDFPIDLNQEPDTYQEAAVTQLFYTNNMMHDIVYAYGFDEEAGNFQDNNYDRGGAGNDYVNANAQDGSGENNANFSTPPDGQNGRMQMFLWNSSSSVFTVNSPVDIAGSLTVGTADFGMPIDTTPISGEVAIVSDGSIQPTLGCEELQNSEELAGKVALIDRGICEFGRKVLNAQNAGAIAAIICNFEDDVINMAGGEVGNQVEIPSVFLGASDCAVIRQFAGNGLNVTFQLPSEDGPSLIDGDLDNGIIAHEYGHGISNRLTGGPSAASCLFNDEQMGEGWSDYFTLVTTVKEGDTGDMGRGIGAFAVSQTSTGPGIRRQRYSTDMSINDQVLDDIIGTAAPHPLGEIWTVTLWDLYWALVDEYGWDPDLINGTGGNNIAIQLVMDGMKLQSCEPGFVDGRNAIIVADELNYDGIHECLIWEVFARRGIGFNADQNSSNNRNDNEQNFAPKPQCIRELKIEKSVTEFIQPGDDIEVTLTITNHKGDSVTNVIVEDLLPEGTSFITGSEQGAAAIVDGNTVRFELGDIPNDESIVISYQVGSDEQLFSITQLFDDVENNGDLWFFDNVNSVGIDIWEQTELDAFSGEKSWYVPNVEEENDQVLFLREPIEVVGEQPVLRFTHRFDTESRLDGGFLEYSTDEGENWLVLSDQLFRDGYVGPLAYNTVPIPNLQAFSGDSDDWITTYVDLSQFAGETVNFRFRFASDLEAIPNSINPGWYVDDIEIMDMVNYDTEACVMSNQGDMACDRAPERGTIVDSATPNSVSDPLPTGAVEVFPNPASSLLNVALDLQASNAATIDLFSMDGRLMQSTRVDLNGTPQIVPFNVSQLPAGMYMVKVQAGSRTSVEKVVLR